LRGFTQYWVILREKKLEKSKKILRVEFIGLYKIIEILCVKAK